MEEKSVRIYNANTTFFGKLTSTLNKLFIPTKIGINSVLISLKRNNLLKAYQNVHASKISADKKETFEKKYEDYYAIYLEAIDKYIMEAVYTNVKNGNASEFEKNALTKYYEITHLKDNEYLEYKYRKQKYLLELDYESIQSNGKTKLHQKYVPFYVEKMDALYKSILKNYSVQLSDNIHTNLQYRNQIFLKIFDTLDEYVSQIIPIKREICQSDELKVLNREYGKYEKFTVGKLDEKDCIEKNVVLLGISRELFTHSLPLVVAEQCYLNLIDQIRDLMVEAKTTAKQEEEYKMLIEVLDEYNMKLLSTKIYWSNPNEREAYKNFWDQYNKAKDQTEKEILLLRRDLRAVNRSTKDYHALIVLYKNKLVKYGVMKNIKNHYQILDEGYVLYGKLSRNRICRNRTR